MKKFLSIFCCLFIVIGISACAKEADDFKIPWETVKQSTGEETKEESGETEESSEESGGSSSGDSSSFTPITNGGNYTPNNNY